MAYKSIGLVTAEGGDILQIVLDYFVAPVIPALKKLLNSIQHQFKIDKAILSELFQHLAFTRSMYLV